MTKKQKSRLYLYILLIAGGLGLDLGAVMIGLLEVGLLGVTVGILLITLLFYIPLLYMTSGADYPKQTKIIQIAGGLMFFITLFISLVIMGQSIYVSGILSSNPPILPFILLMLILTCISFQLFTIIEYISRW